MYSRHFTNSWPELEAALLKNNSYKEERLYRYHYVKKPKLHNFLGGVRELLLNKMFCFPCKEVFWHECQNFCLQVSVANGLLYLSIFITMVQRVEILAPLPVRLIVIQNTTFEILKEMFS